jgi:phage terminase large subunit-like protein
MPGFLGFAFIRLHGNGNTCIWGPKQNGALLQSFQSPQTNVLEQYKNYLEQIDSGKVLACRYVHLAVERQIRDLQRQHDPDFPFYFDEDAAARAIGFFRILRHTKGEWASQRQHFQLKDFQAFRLAVVFGWKKKSNHKRRFTRAYIETARKSGKTEEGAGVMLIGLNEGEAGAEIYSAATTRDQARIVFTAAKEMARQLRQDSEMAAGSLQILAHRVLNTSNNSFIQALSADAHTLDGLNPHFSCIDEMHAHPDRKVLDVIETGMGSRSQPLVYIITTAGFNVEGPCYALRKTAIDILEGIKVDESFFSIIYTLDEGDDWELEANWIKANPNLGNTPKLDWMREQYTKAKNEGWSKRVEFLTKNLNIWQNARETWVPDEVYHACALPFALKEMEGRACHGGLDLAATSDFNALSLFFPKRHDDEANRLLRFYWIPEAAAERRHQDGPSFRTWADEGHMKITDGNVTDYSIIRQDINAIVQIVDLRSLAFDRALSAYLVQDLTADGVRMEPFNQGIMHISPPTKELERLIVSGDLEHDGNPVTRWMYTNVTMYRDNNDNYRPNKGKSTDKIDGVMADIMAVGEWLIRRADTPVSSYLLEDDTELITF